MTRGASWKMLVNDDALAVATNTPSGVTEYALSGRLTGTLPVGGDLSDNHVTWFAIACRERTATLTVNYTTGAAETFVAEPGSPILYQSRDNDAVTSATVAPVDDFVDIEIMVYTGTTALNPDSPAYLVLDAGAGVTVDPFAPASVTAWTDARAVSLAPLPFEWEDENETYPTLISEDSDFNGRPSIQFGEGEAAFLYSGVASVFDFMDGSSDGEFTVLMIASFPDDAENTADYQGIWNVSAATTNQGYRAYIDPAYRLTTYLAEQDESDTVTQEFAPKPSVIIWRVEGQALRVYFQGRWQDYSASMPGASPGDNSRLRIGEAMRPGVGALPMSYFRGKIANITVYNRALDTDECDAYIARAVSDYGVDDTEEPGFPWLSDVVNFHRANRGLSWSNEETFTLSTWYDTRPEVSSNASGWTVPSGRGTPTYTTEDATLAAPAWVFNGTDDALSNPFSSTSGDHFGGSGLTVTMVMYLPTLATEASTAARAVLTQGAYDDDYANLQGTSIRLNGRSPLPSNILTYELDNILDQDVVSTTGSELQPLVPYAFAFRSDGTSWWVDELNIATGTRVKTATGTLAAAESANTSAAMWMGAFPSTTSGSCNLGVAEMASVASRKTNAQVTEFFEYVSNRYAT